MKARYEGIDTLLMHGRDWNGKLDLTGWFIQEKHNGCRAIWTGEWLVSRGGNVINAPKCMVQSLPRGVLLDGEIHAGRGGYRKSVNFVQHGQWCEDIRFTVFDLPKANTKYADRLRAIQEGIDGRFVHCVAWTEADNSDFADKMRMTVQEAGGEGVVAWNPDALWQSGRTNNLVKLK